MAKAVNKDPIEEYRYERKFVTSELTVSEIELLVRFHPAMFSEIYKERFVNSLYLDSLDKRNYFDNVNGLQNRVKVRLRWYGDLFGEITSPTLELKIKKDRWGRKETYPLTPFSLNAGFSLEELRSVFKSSDISESLKTDLLSLEWTLQVRYKRKYYQSACHNYRITIDSDIAFCRPPLDKSYLLSRPANPMNTVMELKYACSKAESAARIVNYFPFRMTKNSKYVSGLESLNLW